MSACLVSSHTVVVFACRAVMALRRDETHHTHTSQRFQTRRHHADTHNRCIARHTPPPPLPGAAVLHTNVNMCHERNHRWTARHALMVRACVCVCGCGCVGLCADGDVDVDVCEHRLCTILDLCCHMIERERERSGRRCTVDSKHKTELFSIPLPMSTTVNNDKTNMGDKWIYNGNVTCVQYPWR